jgi:putative ABC transport system permease protein
MNAPAEIPVFRSKSAPPQPRSGKVGAVGGGITLRFALREVLGGLRGFYVFIACIALGVAAIAGVGSTAGSLIDGLAREGRVILGGDVAFSLTHREAEPGERAFLQSRGTVSAVATLRAMARAADGQSALVELKAVDAGYPLYGTVGVAPPHALPDLLAERGGVFGAAAEPALLARLNLQPGARLTVGGATLELRAVLTAEPDKLAGGIAFGPRLLIGDAALRATGLIQPGSLVRWHYRLRLPDNDGSDQAANATVRAAQAAFPDAGWEVRTSTNVSPQLERSIERFLQYLTLVGLTALLVGGVGVANAVKGHLDRKREVIATLKSLGATGRRVFAIYLLQVLMLAGGGAVIGVALGAALPFLIVWLFGALIPLPMAPSLQPLQLATALLYGLLTALAFGIWPLGRAHDVPVSALFRDEIAPERRWPRLPYMLAAALAVAVLAGLAIALAYDRGIAAIFVFAAAAVFAALHGIALLIMALAARAPRARAMVLRLAVANIHRAGALTPTVVLSLGTGLTLLVTVVLIDGNLRQQFLAALPDKAPSFFFLDIQAAEAERFDAFIRAQAPAARLERTPMLRGRIVSVNGTRAEDLKPSSNARWVLQSDRGITYTAEIPAGSRVVAGQWWGAGETAPLVSLERRIADDLGIRIGDEITVNVLGRNISAKVANLRTLDWQSLGINFVFVFSPATFLGAPNTHIATLTYPGGAAIAEETALLKSVGESFPAITAVSVREALNAVGALIGNLVSGIRGASAITLLAAVLVLGGALAAGHRHRVYDAVILKTLGATRGRLVGAYALEYLLLGAATALFGLAAGSIAAWLVVTRLMNLSFTFLPAPAIAAALCALLITVAFGLVGTVRALGQKPAGVLRNL